jgi:hypothetical protein
MTASLLARQNPNRAHELVQAVSRAKFPTASETELDRVQQFFVDEFGSLRESWKHMVHAGKSVSLSPRSRAMTLPTPTSGEVALDEHEFKVALERHGFSGNASQAWRQLGQGSQKAKSTTSTRDLSVDRARPASRSADGARETASARSSRRPSEDSAAPRAPSVGAERGKSSLSRTGGAGAESDAEAVLRASLVSLFKSVGAGVRAIQKRQANPSEVKVSDLFETLKKGNPRFGYPELKRLLPGSERSETLTWAELGLEAEAARPAPQTSIRASAAIEQLSDLLTAAANELRGGAHGLKAADGGKAAGRFL